MEARDVTGRDRHGAFHPLLPSPLPRFVCAGHFPRTLLFPSQDLDTLVPVVHPGATYLGGTFAFVRSTAADIFRQECHHANIAGTRGITGKHYRSRRVIDVSP